MSDKMLRATYRLLLVLASLLFALPATAFALAVIQASPADAIAVPADYDGDGFTDFALKGSNGIWYIDVAKCSRPEPETACTGTRDDDFDERVNDGCPAVGAAETGTACTDNLDNDNDGHVNDGCVAAGRECVGADGFGGRWDFVYWGYGNSTGVPVPADYDGDGRADLAIRDSTTGMWAIDFADNGFGAFDVQVWLGGQGVPVPADYDGDGRADLAIKTAQGDWYIDISSDGFGSWDPRTPFHGYGGSNVVPVPADYDGDGCADLAIKDPSVTPSGAIGTWYIDYARVSGNPCGLNGFQGWDSWYPGYGNAAAVPVPADYDGDGKADLAVKDGNGTWYIDYYAIGGFGEWNEIKSGYGGAWSVATPGHYELTRDPRTDKRLDLSVKDTNGYWYTDLASDGYTGWNYIPNTGVKQLSNPSRVLVNTIRPYIYSTKVYGESGPIAGGMPNEIPAQLTVGVRYAVDVVLRSGSGYGWDFIERCHAGDLDCASVEVNPDLRVPGSLNVINPIGSSYAVIPPTIDSPNKMTCTSNNDCVLPNQGQGDCDLAASKCNWHRRYAFTCTEPGQFALGFQVRNAPPYSGGAPFNFDYGLRVQCTSPKTGLYGRVTKRGCSKAKCGTGEKDANNVPLDGVYTSGTVGVGGAMVTVSGYPAVMTDSAGNWWVPSATGGPLTVTVVPPTGSPYSKTIAVNVRVPVGSGMQVDTPLEESFTALSNAGISYMMYIDYSRGRILYHTLTVNPASSVITADQTPINLWRSKTCKSDYTGQTSTSSPDFKTLLTTANEVGALALINSMWWDPCTGEPVGYMYSTTGYKPSNAVVWCDGGTLPSASGNCVNSHIYRAEGGGFVFPQNNLPLFTVKGTSRNQLLSIVESHDNFWELPSSQWGQTPFPNIPIWDNSPRNGVSDVDYAFQIGNPPLVWNGAVVAGGDFLWSEPPYTPYDHAYARTAVGIGPGVTVGTTLLYLVVADGEGVQGGNGPTGNQLGRFFKDVLHATAATALDSGLSTEMVLKTTWMSSTGLRHVNTITGEDATIQLNPYGEVLTEGAGYAGSVAGYLAVRGSQIVIGP